MKKLFLVLFISIFSAHIIACSGFDDTSKVMTDAEIVANSIIDFPGCISSKGDSSKPAVVKTGSSDDAVTDIYEGIRENIGAIEEWTEIIKTLVGDIFDLTGNNPSGSWSNNYPESDEPSKIEWGPSDRPEYETMVELYWLVSDVDTLGFQAYITINSEEQTAKGEFIWDFSVVPDEENPSNEAALRIVFDGTSDPKTLMIKAVGIDNSTDPDEPENAWIEATHGSDHIFTMSGNYYFHDIKIFDDSVAAEDRNYVFTVIAFDEDYIAGKPSGSTGGNKAILQLALPLSSVGELDGWEALMWDEDSIGNIYCEKIKEVWNNIPLSVADLNDYTNNELGLSAASVLDLTSNDVVDILEWIVQNDPNGIYKEMLFVLNLVNPAYFNAYGFVGTYDESLGRGTLDSTPSGYDGLDISNVQAIAPDVVKALTIEFYDL